MHYLTDRPSVPEHVASPLLPLQGTKSKLYFTSNSIQTIFSSKASLLNCWFGITDRDVDYDTQTTKHCYIRMDVFECFRACCLGQRVCLLKWIMISEEWVNSYTAWGFFFHIRYIQCTILTNTFFTAIFKMFRLVTVSTRQLRKHLPRGSPFILASGFLFAADTNLNTYSFRFSQKGFSTNFLP